MEDYVSKEIGYYLRDDKNQPKTAVSVVTDLMGNMARGVSICNPCDQFVKAEGRELSKLRAYKALEKGRSFGPIRREGLLIDQQFIYKCEFMPALTEYEVELLKDPESV